MKIELYLTPLPFGSAELENMTVVVIDVLRSSTSICAALQAGAKNVIPVDGPGQAGEMLAKIGADIVILAGEQNGVKIDNFHLGNSPAEFTADNVSGKQVVMSTTNGTAIFGNAHSADPVISCGLVNISLVAERAANQGKDMAIVCSGRKGGFSIEDTICGGMLVHLLQTKYEQEVDLNDAGSLALLLYRNNKTDIDRVITEGEHGRFLESIGFGDDIHTATQIDSIPVLPTLVDGCLTIENNNKQ